jgi:hypothetical protein
MRIAARPTGQTSMISSTPNRPLCESMKLD